MEATIIQVLPLADCWTTELHLSFLQLKKGINENNEEDSVPKTDNICFGIERRFPTASEGSQLSIVNASVSYRMIGDMADKYWTSYLLYLPKTDRRDLEYPQYLHKQNEVESWFHGNARSDQRRILEPLLVGKMVAEIYRSTGEILRSIDEWLEPDVDPSQTEQGSTPSIYVKADDRNFDVQIYRSTTCLELNATLSVLRRLSIANVDSLTQWEQRELTRHYKPRWSEKDEYGLRELVDHQQRRAKQQISLLRDQGEQIETRLEQIKTHRQEVNN